MDYYVTPVSLSGDVDVNQESETKWPVEFVSTQ